MRCKLSFSITDAPWDAIDISIAHLLFSFNKSEIFLPVFEVLVLDIPPMAGRGLHAAQALALRAVHVPVKNPVKASRGFTFQ